MNKLVLMLLLAFGLPFIGFSQNITIKGKVVDDNNVPIPKASVLGKGLKKGTQTDENGNFSITITPVNQIGTLVVSCVSYGTKIVTSDGNSPLTVKLTKEVTSGDEVVVVGYQTMRRKDLSGSVSSVSSKQLKDLPVNTGAEALTGKAAGVQVTSNEGGPGADYTIKLRGGTSITQDNNPLYIVDGIAVDNALSVISPQDIQTIDILKDAAATAIYGSRGANGVIIITTKSGKASKKLSVSYNAYFGWKELPKELELMQPYDFVVYQYERAGANLATSADISRLQTNYGTANFDTLGQFYKNTPFIDWQKTMMGRKAFQQSHNLSLSGGDKKTQYNLSLGYNAEQGILVGTDYSRALASFKIDHQFSTKFKMGLTGRINSQQLNGAGVSPGVDENGVTAGRLRNIIKYVPLENSHFNPNAFDPSLIDQASASQGLVNPLILSQNDLKKKINNVYNFTTNASYTINSWLSFKTTIGFDRSVQYTKTFSDTVTYVSRAPGNNHLPVAGIDTITKTTLTNSNVLTYSNAKGKGHFKKNNSLQILLGHETIQLNTTEQNSVLHLFSNGVSSSEVWHNLFADTAHYALGYPQLTKVESRLLSFFTKVNYAYKDKYLATLSYRADGSSKFAPGNRWGYFPAGSVAWKVSKEDFMQKVKFVSEFKLRFSYGTSGNNRIDDYAYLQNFTNVGQGYYGVLNNTNSSTTVTAPVNILTNTFLKWETTTSRNFGIDITLFKKLQLTVDLYKNTSADLLLLNPIASPSYVAQYQNAGATENKGVEFQMVYPIISHKNFDWSANFNISFNKNIVTSLGDQPSKLVNSGISTAAPTFSDYYAQPGQPLGQIYGYVNDGWYLPSEFSGYNNITNTFTPKPGTLVNNSGFAQAQPGSIKFKDLNGDGVIDSKDETVIGNANPKFFGGLTQQFRYKKFDASIFVNFVYGNQVYNANKLEFIGGYNTDQNMLAIMKDRWKTMDANGNVVTDLTALTALNKDTKIWKPIVTQNFNAMSWAVEDGSFLRINNVTVGYTFGFKKNSVIRSLRAYATVNNVAVFTSYSGYDPEVNVRTKPNNFPTPGLDYSAYPKARSFVFGLNANF